MQIGFRQGLVNAALIGPKGTTALQHQCDALERRTLSRDMGLAQQRLTVGHHGPPILTARVALSDASLRSSFRCSRGCSMQFHVRFVRPAGRANACSSGVLKKLRLIRPPYLPTIRAMLTSVCVLDYADSESSPRRPSRRSRAASFAVLIFVGQKMRLKPPGVEQAGCPHVIGPSARSLPAPHIATSQTLSEILSFCFDSPSPSDPMRLAVPGGGGRLICPWLPSCVSLCWWSRAR